jgi:uncharacterized protein (DUF1499 family)
MKKSYSARRLLIRFGFLAFLATLGLFGLSMSAKSPAFPAASGGNRFAACPDSPNCVSTQQANRDQLMQSLDWQGPPSEAVDAVRQIVAKNFDRAKLIDEQENYLRFEFTSLIFRFVDDVEFLVDEQATSIHFRSASRVGRSDLGANRRRMDRFVKAWQAR